MLSLFSMLPASSTKVNVCCLQPQAWLKSHTCHASFDTKISGFLISCQPTSRSSVLTQYYFQLPPLVVFKLIQIKPQTSDQGWGLKDRSQRSGGQVCSDFTAMEETHGIIEQEKVLEIGFLNLDGVSEKLSQA